MFLVSPLVSEITILFYPIITSDLHDTFYSGVSTTECDISLSLTMTLPAEMKTDHLSYPAFILHQATSTAYCL